MPVSKAYMVLFTRPFSHTHNLRIQKTEVNTDIFFLTGLISYFRHFFEYFQYPIAPLCVQYIILSKRYIRSLSLIQKLASNDFVI